MGEMTFTPSQEDAINAKGGAILVSAAAGSGKTRVLVERVINRLTDKDKPIDADKFLIVTFTNAAAAEMKKRISDAIDEKLAKNPDDEKLRRQQLLLPRANISTVHSFCSNIVRENFFELNINHDFRIADESETEAMRNRVMSDLIEEMYAKKSDDFLLLSSILSSEKSDSGLESAILDVYEKSLSHPFPEQWIAEAVEFYDPGIHLADTIFAKKALEKVKYITEYFRVILDEVYEVIDANPIFQGNNKTSAINAYGQFTDIINSFDNAADTGVWSNISNLITSYKKPSYTSPKKNNPDVTENEINAVRKGFDTIDDIIKKKLQPLFGYTDEIYCKDTQQLYRAVKCLQEILREFNKRYLQAKNEKGILEFSDLEHLMLKLLVKQTNSGYEKTDFARSLSQQFAEIMIDEYQDTNEIQERIFWAISDDEKNIFVVGDVKQSIYRFREAMPEIFIHRRENSSLYDRNNPQFPAKIILDKNFRSRESIIDSVNYVFNLLMSKRMGDIDYNDEEKLVMGATYSEKEDTELELHIIKTDENSTDNSFENDGESDGNEDYEELSKDEKEARHIVEIINNMIKNKKTVSEKDGERPIQYSDICILLRNKSAHAGVFSKILNENGIPAHTDKSNSFFECYEVNVALSFLKIVNNPLQDISLLSVMMSSVVGFTADDLALIRKSKNQPLYLSVYFAAKPFLEKNVKEENSVNENENLTEDEKIVGEKCAAFINELSYFRRLSVTVPVSRLLDVFFEKTSYIEAISAMTNGQIRVQNVRKLMNFIRNYEDGSSGLTAFIHLLTHIEESNGGIQMADTSPSDSVSIMTIHHSKGLEFPVCIMAATSSKGSNDKSPMHCHSQLGIGINSIDTDNMLKFRSLQNRVIYDSLMHEKMSEELRVLYVAMTRAKEKLIVIASVKSKDLNTVSNSLKVKDGKIIPYSVEKAQTFANMIIMCALLHPSMSELRSDAGAEDIITIPTKSKWKYVPVKDIPNGITETTEEYTEQIDNDFMDFLKTRFQKKYSHASRTLIPSKVSASALAHNDSKFDFVATSRPAFMQEKKMTGSERGTAMHMFMQYADFSKISDNAESEKQRISEQEFMSAEQINALNDDDINKFTHSELFNRMIHSEKLYKEYRFTVNISAKDIDENADCDDSVILQGAIDCIFIENGELVIVDYKTDRVKEVSELSSRYAKQLKLYKNAAEQVFEMPVKECIIYSLHLGEQTTI